MLVVRRGRAGEIPEACLEARCAVCQTRFRGLTEAWLAFPWPVPAGAWGAVVWAHRKCIERDPPPGGPHRLWRSDHALYTLIKGLLRAELPVTAGNGLPGPRRPWCDP